MYFFNVASVSLWVGVLPSSEDLKLQQETPRAWLELRNPENIMACGFTKLEAGSSRAGQRQQSIDHIQRAVVSELRSTRANPPVSFLNLKRTPEMITYVEMISHRESQCHSVNPEISQTHVSIMSIISFVQES